MVKGFSKMYNFSFFEKIIFCKHFYHITGFCDKKFNFCKFAKIFADSKSRAQELSNDVIFVIFGQKPNKTVHCPFMLMVRKKARFWL